MYSPSSAASLHCLRYESSLKSVFEDKVEELVIPDDPIVAGKKSENRRKPDRIFGLRETKNFETLLDKIPITGQDRSGALRDTLQYTPFKDVTNNPLLFPFLILEAKSEISNDAFTDIEFQTAYPIKILLELQLKLFKQAAGTKVFEPLVWFLGHRGDTWKVYACYMSDDKPPTIV